MSSSSSSFSSVLRRLQRVQRLQEQLQQRNGRMEFAAQIGVNRLRVHIRHQRHWGLNAPALHELLVHLDRFVECVHQIEWRRMRVRGLVLAQHPFRLRVRILCGRREGKRVEGGGGGM